MACGGAAASAASGATQPPSSTPAAAPETMALSYLLVPAGPRTPTALASLDALREAMITAGYKVVVDPGGSHDAELVVHVTAEEQRSMFVVVVNGKRDVKERVHLAASVMTKGEIVDEVAADFVAANGQVNQADVTPAVSALGASSRIASRAKQIRSAAYEDANRTQRVAEETDWNRARVTGCSRPSSLSGCDAVRTYLATYPTGAHVDEAQAALKASAPRMEQLQKDENAWKSAGDVGCRATQSRDACEGVEIYVTKFPAGVHLDEAQASLRGVQ